MAHTRYASALHAASRRASLSAYANELKDRFKALRAAYPGRKLLVVSNTAGALSYDSDKKLASEVEGSTGLTVLAHRAKKPGCGDEVLSYFRQHPETGVSSPHQIAIVGDRLSTDMMLANMMGSWGIWIKEGVVPHQEKSIVSLALPTISTWHRLTLGSSRERIRDLAYS